MTTPEPTQHAAPDTTPASGPVVLLVGGTSGIGLATARRLAAGGARVVVCSRDEGRVGAVARDLPGAQGTTADIRDPAAVQRVVDACVRDHGRLDAVVLTAQVMAYGTVEQVPPEVVSIVHDVAVHGTSHVARAVLPVFRRQGGGSLVVVGSLLAEITVPSMGAYCTAKAAQHALVRTLQHEVRRERGIHVSLVAPGAIDTPIYEQAATYAGQSGHAPPPIIGADAVARAVVRAIDHPRRLVHVGPANRVAVFGYRVLPALYDVLIGPMARLLVFRGPQVPASPGNVLRPRPEREAVSGGWRWWGGRSRP
jgi:NAD(P)-dependent dehydrogenase (short-subunit alcohol dehydrogenase family)